MKTINLKTATFQVTIIIGTLLAVQACGDKCKPEANKEIVATDKILLINDEPILPYKNTVRSSESNSTKIVLKKPVSKSVADLNKIVDEKIVLSNRDSLIPTEKISVTPIENDVQSYVPEVTISTETSNIIKPNMISEKVCCGLNSESSEMGAIVSPDGKTLYFSRSNYSENVGGKKDDEDIWYSDWDEAGQKWGEAKNIGTPLNNKYPNFINSISPDGNTLLLGNIYCTNGEMLPGLSLSKRTELGWGFPEEIVFEGNPMQPAVSACQLSFDQKTLFLAYEQRKNTCGGDDIYVSFLQANMQWSLPINLGSMVNTNGKETAPFLAADGITLYYTTNGQPGFGGDDIYVITRLDETWQNWSTPKNLGPKVNTNSDQSFFAVSNGKIYFSSEVDAKGNLDLFTFITPESPMVVTETKEEENNNSNELSASSLKLKDKNN